MFCRQKPTHWLQKVAVVWLSELSPHIDHQFGSFFISLNGTKENGSAHGKHTVFIRFTILLFVFLLVSCREGNPHHRRSSSTGADLAITKAEFFQVLRSPRIGQRALYWTRRGQPFVKILRQGGRGCTLLIDTLSAEIFYAELLEGKCQPPPMPGEHKKDCR
jgi:hypothetical protein